VLAHAPENRTLVPGRAAGMARQRNPKTKRGEVQLRRTDGLFARLFDWFEAPDVSMCSRGCRRFDDRIRLEEEVVANIWSFAPRCPASIPRA